MISIQKEVIMKGKMIIVLILVFSTTISQAQKKKVYIPPDWKTKTHSFFSSELQIDCTFMGRLNTVVDSIISKQNDSKSWHHFHIKFEKKDTLNYDIEISLWDIPAKNSIGFYKHNEYLYWFGVDIPPDFILGEKNIKRFSYKDPFPGPYDPPFWFFTYNRQTGRIEVKERHCFE